MSQISPAALAVFMLIYAVVIVMAIASGWFVFEYAPVGDFRPLLSVMAAVILFFVYLVIAYRIFLKACPLHLGEIERGSQQHFVYFIYILFFLLGFHVLLRSNILPVPLVTLLYVALGAQLGENTYPAGVLADPLFVKIGKNGVVGHNCLLTSHMLTVDRLAHYMIEIGDDVTIGAMSVIMPGVKIGNNAIVAAGALVKENTIIGENELWGGVPAKLITKRD